MTTNLQSHDLQELDLNEIEQVSGGFCCLIIGSVVVGGTAIAGVTVAGAVLVAGTATGAAVVGTYVFGKIRGWW